jgi:transcriptional regulator with XRE-family HTH domain
MRKPQKHNLTSFALLLRHLRIERNEIQADMASKLRVSSAYLSAIERGVRTVPEWFLPRLGKVYPSLTDEELIALEEAKMTDEGGVWVKFGDRAGPCQRSLAFAFQLAFPYLPDDDADRLNNLLEEITSGACNGEPKPSL